MVEAVTRLLVLSDDFQVQMIDLDRLPRLLFGLRLESSWLHLALVLVDEAPNGYSRCLRTCAALIDHVLHRLAHDKLIVFRPSLSLRDFDATTHELGLDEHMLRQSCRHLVTMQSSRFVVLRQDRGGIHDLVNVHSFLFEVLHDEQVLVTLLSPF